MSKRDDALRELAQTMHGEEMGDAETAGVAKHTGRWLSPVSWYPKTKALKRELQMMAWNEETSMAALIHEGLEEVFRRRGKKMEDYL